MIFGEEEKKKFESAKTCWICEWPFENSGEKKVRDHCHFSGKFRGAAHNSCNLLFRKPKFTPVFFHNLTGYDSHLFVKGISNVSQTMRGNSFLFPRKFCWEFKMMEEKKKKIWHEIRFCGFSPIHGSFPRLSGEKFD